MKFISLARLAFYFELEISPIDDELIGNTKDAVNQYFLSNDLLHAFGQDFNFQDLIFILDQLQEEKIRVFHGWIEQDAVLSEYLISNGEKLSLREEVVLRKDHQLFEAYQNFLDRYLTPILTNKIAESLKGKDLFALGNHLLFSSLLTEKTRIACQQTTVAYLRQLLTQLKVRQGVDLQDQLKLVFSYEFVNVLNALDEYFYSDSIAYIDTAKLIVQKNDLSPLILDKIKSAISNVRLNKKHFEQVQDFCNSDVFNARRKTPRSNLNDFVRSPLFFVAVIAIVINFIFFYPMGEEVEEKNAIEETTGIDGLSDEELKKVDTLLGYQRDSLIEPVEFPDVSSRIILVEDSLE